MFQTELDRLNLKGEWEPEHQKQIAKQIPNAWQPFARDMAGVGVLVGFPR